MSFCNCCHRFHQNKNSYQNLLKLRYNCLFEGLQMVVNKEKVRKIRSSAFSFKTTNFWTCAKMPENRVSGGKKSSFPIFSQIEFNPKRTKNKPGKRLGDCSDTLEITHLTHVLCQHYVFWDQLLTFALPYSPSLS